MSAHASDPRATIGDIGSRGAILPPPFLDWLERFVGIWEYDSAVYHVRRRQDGWLACTVTAGEGSTTSELADVFAYGRRSPTQDVGPLGPGPIVVSQELMDYWLDGAEWRRFLGATHVSTGRAMAVEAIERRMAELGHAAVHASNRTQWAMATRGGATLSARDDRLARALWARFREETAAVIPDGVFEGYLERARPQAEAAPAKQAAARGAGAGASPFVVWLLIILASVVLRALFH